MATFTRSTKDGIFTVDLTIQDEIESFSGESLMELAEILTDTANWIRTMLESEDRDEMLHALQVKGES